jgi:hypothetical protein
MHDLSPPWLSLFVLGGVHGINPAMGWLFAVARGLQLRDRRALWRAFGPLALGHALAIAAAIMAAAMLGRVLPLAVLRWVVAAALLVVGLDALRRHRHLALGSMRVSSPELAAWSFLMASVHGAGLMVLPFVLGTAAPHGSMHHDHLGLAMAAIPGTGSALTFTAPLIHTLGYLTMTVALAVVVYEKAGLAILRRAWINVNALWAVALLASGVLTLLP